VAAPDFFDEGVIRSAVVEMDELGLGNVRSGWCCHWQRLVQWKPGDRKPGFQGNSQELIPERVIHFSRTDLQLYQEDIYDAKGAIQTTAVYGPMQAFGQQKFPGTVTVKRPLEELQILITIQN
jgi:hypothetical protein